MKRVCFLLILLAFTLISTDTFGVKGKKVWILYDDFGKGYIDIDDKWVLSQPQGTTIIVENGMAKIAYPGYSTASSAWLRIKDTDLVKKIKGIKAKIYIAESSGDFRARIGTYPGGIIGGINDYWVFGQLAFEPTISVPRIFGNLSVLTPAPSFTWQYDSFYGQFTRPGSPSGTPLQLIGQTFEITMTFTPEKVTYEVEGFGEIEHKLPEGLDPIEFYFLALGCRGTGGGTVYFDDVYILVEE